MHRRTFYAVSVADYALDFHVLIVAALLVVERTGSGTALFAVAASNWLSETVFEVPTGYVADRYGRTLSTAGSFALRGVGFLVIAASHSLVQFVVGWVIVGLGSTLLSGALEAWAVDHEHQADNDVDSMLLRAQRATSLAMVAAIAAAVAIGSISYAAPFVVVGVAGLVLAPIVAIRMGPDAGVASRAEARNESKLRARQVVASRRYRPLFLLGGLLTCAMAVPGVQWAPAVEAAYPAFALVPLGTVRAIGPALRTGFNWLVEAVLGRVGRRWTFVGILGASAVLLAVVASGDGAVLIVGFAAFSAIAGVAPVLLGARLNEVIERPEWRATILSVYSATISLVTGIGLLAVGAFIGDPADRRGVWSTAAIALLGLSLAVCLRQGLLEEQSNGAVARAG